MKKTGFTLIELSIVLVVIALLVGGVLTGQSLIRSSEIRNTIVEYAKFVKGISEFRDKYYALPGDMTNAESNWGADSNCPNTASNTAPKIATCNGDGNGHIGDSDMDGAMTVSREWFRAWQQLGNSGVIEGHYTGTSGPNNAAEAVVGTNVPKSVLSGAGWTLLYYLFPANGSPDTGPLWRDQYGHLLVLGAPSTNSYTSGAAMAPIEAFTLDSKMDDGKPGRGIIRAFRTSLLTNCTLTDTTQDAQAYNSAYKPDACALAVLTGF